MMWLGRMLALTLPWAVRYLGTHLTQVTAV